MDAVCKLIRLKPGSLPLVREWAKTMNERMKEVLATLHDESVVVESVFLLTRDDGDYLVIRLRFSVTTAFTVHLLISKSS